jgi:hypothetical protein
MGRHVKFTLLAIDQQPVPLHRHVVLCQHHREHTFQPLVGAVHGVELVVADLDPPCPCCATSASPESTSTIQLSRSHNPGASAKHTDSATSVCDTSWLYTDRGCTFRKNLDPVFDVDHDATIQFLGQGRRHSSGGCCCRLLPLVLCRPAYSPGRNSFQ